MTRRRVHFHACAALLMFAAPAVVLARSPALQGHCPVRLIKMNKPVKGNREFASTYDGRTYLFASAKDMKTFDANPVAFVPALGGNCVVSKTDEGSIVPGKAAFHVVHGARLYLFPSPKEQEMFEAEPEKYADADLALDGNCPVSLRNRNKLVPGTPEMVSIHDARRYLFVSAHEKRAFDVAPAAYSPALWGNCVVCKVDEHKDVSGIPDHNSWFANRMYVFSSTEHKRLFSSKHAKYANADIAFNGNCPVFKCGTRHEHARQQPLYC